VAARRSAGILLYRKVGGDEVEVLVAHPGGPLWAKRDAGWWSIPKGLLEPGEDEASAARREFEEETGSAVTEPMLDLGTVTLKSGKVVHAFAAEGDLDPDRLESNSFRMEWPPHSGRTIEAPEIDRVAWCAPVEAKRLLNPAQAPLVDRLIEVLGAE
jgi:predicted NUDIX family NTP pyrophosphohydrolase